RPPPCSPALRRAGVRRSEAGADPLAAASRLELRLGGRRHPSQRRRAGTGADAPPPGRPRRRRLRSRDPRLPDPHRRVRLSRRRGRRRRLSPRPGGALLLRQRALRRRWHRRVAPARPVLEGGGMDHLTLRHIPVATTGMLIRRPAAQVFEAFVDPAITTMFWFTKGSGRLEVGRQVGWDWEISGLSSLVAAT